MAVSYFIRYNVTWKSSEYGPGNLKQVILRRDGGDSLDRLLIIGPTNKELDKCITHHGVTIQGWEFLRLSLGTGANMEGGKPFKK